MNKRNILISTLVLSSLLFPLYAEKENSKLNMIRGDVVKVEERFLVHAPKHFNKGDNIISIDASAVSGLSGKIHVNFNLAAKNCIYFEFSMEDVSIDKAIIDDLDITCDIRKTQIDGYASCTSGLFSTIGSSYFHKESDDMPDAEWKAIKLERISNINESIRILDFVNSFYKSGEITLSFDVSRSNNDKLEVVFEIPITPLPESSTRDKYNTK